MDYHNYSKIRFKQNKSRDIVWQEIAKYLQKKFIPAISIILDLGSGYCDFINNIRAKKKYALDKFINPEKFASNETIPIFGDFNLADKIIEDCSLDIILASNFFEHLDEAELERYIKMILSKLKNGGKLIIIQPNYFLCYKNYFDDYTHIKAWSHISLPDFLKSRGFYIDLTKPRFLPFSIKSNLPKYKLLIRAYLNSPIKPFAGQMLVIARKPYN
jgi:SAM-dependent methyltransferase